jgi:DNA-binding phage protein
MSSLKSHKTTKTKALKVKSIDLDSFDEYKSSINPENKRSVVKLLTQMFVAGDHDAFMELMELYIDHIGKREMSKKANIPEKTIYNFKDKKHKTSSENIFKLMKAIN